MEVETEGLREERKEGLSLVSTTDFFYPLVEDPFLQGKIAAANVLSDMYSFGIVRIDSMLMLLGKDEGGERERTRKGVKRRVEKECRWICRRLRGPLSQGSSLEALVIVVAR